MRPLLFVDILFVVESSGSEKNDGRTTESESGVETGTERTVRPLSFVNILCVQMVVSSGSSGKNDACGWRSSRRHPLFGAGVLEAHRVGEKKET